ncbi:MAG: hypothetical protein NVS1B4_13470 [Gemmatimonadaceae bacterium]
MHWPGLPDYVYYTSKFLTSHEVNMVPRVLPPLATTLIAVACGSTEKPAPANTADTPRPDSGHPAANGTRACSDTLAERVADDPDRLARAGSDSVKTLLPTYRTVVNALIADCDKMMRDMKLALQGTWTTAAAAVRAVLART